MKRYTAKDVRALIEAAGMNQCSAARAIGISERSMRRYASLKPGEFRTPPTPVVLALVMLVRAADRENADG